MTWNDRHKDGKFTKWRLQPPCKGTEKRHCLFQLSKQIVIFTQSPTLIGDIFNVFVSLPMGSMCIDHLSPRHMLVLAGAQETNWPNRLQTTGVSAFTTALQQQPSLHLANLRYTLSRRGDKKSSSVATEADKKSQVCLQLRMSHGRPPLK